jgi:hypothetical protein
VVTIRSLYDRQEHKFAGPYRDNRFLEDCIARVRDEPIGCVVLVARNAAGQAQHVVASTGHAGWGWARQRLALMPLHFQ